ncbi:MAG: CDP-diacylglycerol--glycerol-3-phosphate 3-phosphatidyltransferase [bacterium ADurb.Bin157]|mgnify:CR=1 FL=1|jgi:CDP-diacylglycerol--glycerol-3-phosphate 3-phosphatidyltransferase|nr:CDP-diacylglycerol--glycerol-3-phosphate 3-phosphatidyltransferase [Candidatus Riflebacteria bacterium]MDD3376045.1 CDP-diacylglycerol--glycerol-3-phosphate 3-phosphatidyltransferase [Candidatus Riflebacteria bacterium]NLV93293.1 CDP-diacylglycerol--glycerol-3-phosphate 3-phosphatidyltransferase [Candidatus Riflebacteria bacterium]OQB49484.1 MAG: CDP-diacylglycerol--glycerol-3-phosphate 3-phosphatidyltransferase [bacterium ADurb.Bin157]
MTLATKLTLSRVVAIPFFLAAFCYRSPGSPLEGDWGKVIAALIFIAASITDYFDGYIARLYKEVTTFGKFIDPIADKVLVSAALIAMVQYEQITVTSAWVAVIIIAREFCVTGLRLVCAEQGKVIDASNAGKLKTTMQLAAIIASLSLLSLRIYFTTNNMTAHLGTLMQFYSPAIMILMVLAALTTIYSGYDYFKKNWHFLGN